MAVRVLTRDPEARVHPGAGAIADRFKRAAQLRWLVLGARPPDGHAPVLGRQRGPARRERRSLRRLRGGAVADRRAPCPGGTSCTTPSRQVVQPARHLRAAAPAAARRARRPPEPATRARGEEAPLEVVVEEAGCRFAVDVTAPLGVGFYPDLRRGRDAVAARAADRRVLNLFSYTGAFSVRAAKAGAREVVSVDSVAKVHARARRNAELCGLGRRPHRGDHRGRGQGAGALRHPGPPVRHRGLRSADVLARPGQRARPFSVTRDLGAPGGRLRARARAGRAARLLHQLQQAGARPTSSGRWPRAAAADALAAAGPGTAWPAARLPGGARVSPRATTSSSSWRSAACDAAGACCRRRRAAGRRSPRSRASPRLRSSARYWRMVCSTFSLKRTLPRAISRRAVTGGLVVAADQRSRAGGQLAGPFGPQDDEREAVVDLLQAVFDGDAGQGDLRSDRTNRRRPQHVRR